MIFKYLLRILIITFTLVIINQESISQITNSSDKNIELLAKKAKKALDDGNITEFISLSGMYNVISCIDASYCSNNSVVELTPNSSWSIVGDSIAWTIETVSGTDLTSTVVEKIGFGMSADFYFYPDKIDPSLVAGSGSVMLKVSFGMYGGGNPLTIYSDYTVIKRAPDVFVLDVTDGVNESCVGTSSQLTLNGSENFMYYYLYRDGVATGDLKGGTGSALTFTIPNSTVGTFEYTVKAVFNTTSCEQWMDGNPSVIVHSLPVVSAINDSPVCEGGTVNFLSTGGVSYSWTGPESFTSALQSPQRADILYNMAGTYSVLVTDNNGCKKSATTDVVVNLRPTAAVSGTTTICNGGTTSVLIEFTGKAPFNFTYSDGTTSTPVTGHNSSSYSFPVSPNTTTTYTVTNLTDANSCGAIASDITGSAIVTVNPRPTSVLSGGGVATCEGTAVNLSVSLTGTGPWDITYSDGSGTYSATANSSPYTLTVNPATTRTYTITGLSDVNCTAIPADMTGSALVTVNERPTSAISIDGNSVLCDGGSTNIQFDLTGSAPWNLTYTVNGVPTTQIVNATPYLLSVTPDVTTEYIVTALSDSKCSAIASDITGAVTVTVNPRPTADLTGSTTICNGQSAQLSVALTGKSPWNIGYSVNGVPVTSNGVTANPFIINVTPTSNTTYILTSLTDANGCSAQAGDLTSDAVINVNPRPTAILTGGTTLCNGNNTQLNIALTGTGPWSIYMAANGVAMPVINTSGSSYNLSVSPSTTTVYTLIGLTDSNCTALTSDLSGSATVTVNSRPTVVFTGDNTLCNGESTNLTMTLTGAPSWNVTYTYNGTPSNIVVAGPSPYILNVSPNVSTSYKIISITDNNGCSANPSDISGEPYVTVNARPTSVISGSTTTCNGTPVNLSVALTGTAPWSFTYSDGVNSTDITTSSSTYIIPVTPSSATTYTITALSDATGCSAWPADMTGSATVNVDSRPTGTVAVNGSDKLCNGGSTNIRFTFTGDGPWNMTYTVNGTSYTVNNITSPYDLSVSPTITSVYQITALSDANCSAQSTDISGTATVEVYPRPTSTITGSTTICNGDNTSITINLTGLGPWEVEYQVNGVTVGPTTMLNSSNVITVYPITNTTYVVTKVTDANGCQANSTDMPGSAVVNVDPRPTGTLTGGGILCAGSSEILTFNLTGTAPWTINYTVNGVNQSVNSINSSPYTLSVSPTVNTTYIFTGLSDAHCTAETSDISGSVDVEVHPRPTAVISGSTATCYQEDTEISIALTGLAPWSVTYTDGTTPVTVNNILTSPYSFTVNPSVNTTYTLVSVTDGNLCTSLSGDLSGSAIITVNQLPTGNISGGESICNGSTSALTFTFTGKSPWNFTYFNGTTYTNETATTSPFVLNVSPSSSTIYTITAVEDGNLCDAIASGLTGNVLITVKPRPTAVISGTQDICLGETADLSLILTGTAPWSVTYSDGTASYSVNASSSPYTLSVTPSETTTYTITGLSDFSGCSSIAADDLSGSAVVTVNEVAVDLTVQAPASQINTQVCIGNTLTYEATPSLGSGSYSYKYELRSLPSGAWSEVGTNSTYTTLSTLVNGNYEIRITVTDNTTLCYASETSAFEVLSLPSVSLSLSDSDVCLNDLVTITALPSGYVSYQFNIDGIDVNNGANNILDISTLAEGTHNVYVTVDNGSCTNTSTPVQQVIVRPLPTTSLVLDNATRTTVCINETVNFTASGASEYQFYVNNSPYGAQSSTNTLSYSSSDNFNVYVIGYNSYGCAFTSGTINITVSKPVAGLTLSPDKVEHCDNEVLTFTATGGDLYEYFYNNNSQGKLADNKFELDPPVNDDEVYVIVTDSYGCEATSAVRKIIVNPTPDIDLSSDDSDNIICDGDLVKFTATQNANFYYRFFILRNGLDVPVQDGSSNTYTTSTLENGDQVYVIVRDENLCNSISASISMTVNPSPLVTLTVLPSSNIAAGDPVQVIAGGADEYMFLLNGNPIGTWTTNNIWDFTAPADNDIVSVIGRNSYGCEDQHDGITIEVDALPVEYEILAVTESYCSDENGVQLYLAGYEADVNYMLIETSTGSEIQFGLGSVAGGLMTWLNVPEGTYFVRATRTTGIGTSLDFTKTITIVKNPVPSVFNQLPNETISVCTGGIDITLNGSETGISYSLLLNGSMTIQTIAGTGSSLAFDGVYYTGTYTIVAENTTTGCTSVMNGSTIVNALANSTIYNIYSNPSDGHYCPGTTGVQIWLDGSDATATYALYKDNVAYGSTINGTGSPLLVATVSEEGVYMVMVAAASGCIAPMNGSVTVVADPLPTEFTVTADNNGHFCPGGSVKIQLIGQQAGANYTLWRDGTSLETITGLIDDPTLPLEFSAYGVEGIYSITASFTGGCEGPMANTVTLSIDDLPISYMITGDAGFCTGASANIYLNESQSGVDYELFLDGVTTGQVIAGNGGKLTFIVSTAGAYTIQGTYTSTVTGCSTTMSGSVIISEILNPDANVVVSTDLLSANCNTGAPVTILSSEVGVIYELYKQDGGSHVATGITITGNGSDVDFPTLIVDNNATYWVYASRGGCSVILNNSILINVPGAVALYTMTGDGDVCIGDDGGSLGLSGSDVGINYQLFLTGTSSDTPVGSPIAGTGYSLSFGVISTEGDYYIIGTSTGCSNRMLGTFKLRFNPLPVAFQMTGSGIFCDEAVGATIGLNGSEQDVNYRLLWYNGSYNQLMDDVDAGSSGSPLTFDGQFNEGDYTVYARNSITGCTSNMNGTVTVKKYDEPDITGINVTIVDNSYCSFNGGVDVGLTNSEVGVTYSVVDEISGDDVVSVTRTEIGSFVLGKIAAGTYSIIASRSGECIVNISTGVIITEDASPAVYTLTAPASGCASSIDLILSGSEVGVEYQLYSDAFTGDGYSGIKLQGTGSELTFTVTDFVSGESFFWVKAVYYDGTNYGCSSETEWISVNVSQTADDFEGLWQLNDCVYSLGVDVSAVGVGYKLIQLPEEKIVEFMDGNGSEQWFDTKFVSGTFIIKAIYYGSGCESKSDTIILYNPIVFNLGPETGDINVTEIILDGSEVGLHYYLYLEGVRIDQSYITGTGGELNFGTVHVGGIYTVVAVDPDSGCEYKMNGSVAISEEKGFLIPNAFSPNDDTYNDTYKVNIPGTVVKSKLEVFNRWGTIVYISEGDLYNNDWDGRSNTSTMISIGKELPNGTYFYIFTVTLLEEGEQLTNKYNGYIELRR